MATNPPKMPLPPPPLNGAADSVSSAASLYQAYYSQGPGMGPAATQPAAAGGSYSSVVPGGGASAPPNAYPAANPQQSYNPQTTFDSGYAVEMGADGEVHVSGSIPAGVPVSAQPAALSDSDLLAVAAPTTPTMSRSVGFAAPATEPETNSMARTNSASRPPRIKKRATYIRAMVSVLGTFMLPIIFTMCWMRTQPLPIDGSTQLTSFLYHALGVGAPLAFTIYGDLGGGDVDVVIYSSAAYMFAFAGIWYAFGTLSAPPTDFMMYSDFIAIACALIGFFIVGGLFQLLITGKWRWIVPARLGGIDEEYVWWKTSRRPVRGSVAKTDLYYGDGLDHSKDTVSKLAASSFMPTIPDPETIPLKKSGVPIAVSGSPAMGYPDDKSSIYTHMNTLSAMPVEQPDDDDHEEEGFLWGSNDFGTLANDDDEDDYHVQNDLESPALKSGSLARPAAYNSLSQRSVANSELSAGYPTQVASMSRPAVPADVPWYSKESKTWTDMGWTSRYMIAKLFIWGHIAVGSFVMGIHMKSPESWRWFTCFMFPIMVGLEKSIATLLVRGMPEDLYHIIRFESHFLASVLYRLLFFVVRTTWTFLFVLFVEIFYKVFAIGIVHIPAVEKLRAHPYITKFFPAPERDPERRKRTIEEGFFYLQSSDICTCLSVWMLRAATGHIPTMSPEGDMQVKFNIMFAIQLVVELAIIPIYWIFARKVLKVRDFDPLTTGYAYLTRYQVQLCVFALAVYQINLGMLAMGL